MTDKKSKKRKKKEKKRKKKKEKEKEKEKRKKRKVLLKDSLGLMEGKWLVVSKRLINH